MRDGCNAMKQNTPPAFVIGNTLNIRQGPGIQTQSSGDCWIAFLGNGSLAKQIATLINNTYSSKEEDNKMTDQLRDPAAIDAWLCERRDIGNQPHWLFIKDCEWDWTPDANRALKFADLQSAEQIAATWDENIVVCLHSWPNGL